MVKKFSMQAYSTSGYQRYTITELLRPFERTAQLCRMTYLPPFWVAGTHKLELPQIPPVVPGLPLG